MAMTGKPRELSSLPAVKENYLLRSRVAALCLRLSAQEYNRDSRGLRYLQTKFKRHRIFPLQQSKNKSINSQNGTADVKKCSGPASNEN